MNTLKLQLKRKQDGSASMTCVRADGTSTGQKSSTFFVAHDLCHYAAETTLDLKRAFYGMVAAGWDIADFGTPWPRGKFPDDALPDLIMGEHYAAVLGYVLSGQTDVAEEYRCKETIRIGQDELPLAYSISDEQWRAMQTCIFDLMAQWKNLPLGEILELNFPAKNA